jgi:hypothetical protein
MRLRLSTALRTEVNHPAGDHHPPPVYLHVPLAAALAKAALPDTQLPRGVTPGAGLQLRSTVLLPGVRARAAALIPGVPALLQKALQAQPGVGE